MSNFPPLPPHTPIKTRTSFPWFAVISLGLNIIILSVIIVGFLSVEARLTLPPTATELAATEPVATELVATEPVVTELVATEPAATEPVATEPVATELVATEPATTEPVATEPAATEPAASIIEPICSYIKTDLKFYMDGFSTFYFMLPKNVCIYLEKTGEQKDAGANGVYIKVRIWVWVESKYISGENTLRIMEQGKSFFDKPGENVPSSDFDKGAYLKSIPIEVTESTDENFQEVIITGWMNNAYFVIPTPTQ